MFYQKDNYPEENEFVICTVQKILPHSVFCTLDEYKNKEGLLHISEVAPGRIRNIRDYVVESKKIICKILRVDAEKNHIDLSLRRVSLTQRKEKDKGYRQEEKAEKLLETVAKELNLTLEDIYKKAGNIIIQKYGLLHPFFQEVSEKDESLLINLEIDKKIASVLTKIVKEKIKPSEVRINAVLTLINYEEEGIETIKKLLKEIKNINQNISIKYISAPKYSITIKSKKYKEAEEIFKKISDKIQILLKQSSSEGELSR